MKKPTELWWRKIKRNGVESGVWYFTINGKQRSCKTQDKQEAERVRIRVLGEERRKENAEGGITIQEIYTQWLERKNIKAKPKTEEHRKLFLGQFVNDFGLYRIKELRAIDIDRWLTSHKKWHESTYCLVLQILNTMFNWAIKKDFIETNPAKKADAYKCKVRGKEWIIPKEYYQKIEEQCNWRYKNVLVCLYESGARPNEILQLKGDEVDLYEKLITKKEHKMARKGQTRTIIITERMLPILTELKRIHGNDYLFRTNTGNRMTLTGLNHKLYRIKKKIGYKGKISAYSFRHTFGSDHLAAGVPIQFVAGAMGHKGTTTLCQTYAHILDRVAENRSYFDKRLPDDTPKQDRDDFQKENTTSGENSSLCA